MPQIVDQPTGKGAVTAVTQGPPATPDACPSRRRFLGVGFGSGLLGGVCCLGAGIAVGAGVGGLSFLSTWAENYQVYFIVASLLAMALWLGRLVHRNARNGWRGAVKVLVRGAGLQLVVMSAIYLGTLGFAMAVAAIAGVA